MNNATQKKFRQFVLSGAFDSGFGLDLMLKDITIALELARETKTAAPLSAACRELWSAASTLLGAGRDHTEMARLSELLGGVSLSPGQQGVLR
jgi:3-hydroxyisobutyrate dehydrogenase